MAGFVLEFGAPDGEYHVSLDMSRDTAEVYNSESFTPETLSCDEFFDKYPNIVNAMLSAGVIRVK